VSDKADNEHPRFIEVEPWHDGRPCTVQVEWTGVDDGWAYLVDEDGSFVPVDMRDDDMPD
jgi:hypothetical protein